MRGKKTPLADKARAVGIASVTSIAEASRQTGISESAIHKWFHSPEFEELRSRNKEVREDEWRVGIDLSFRRAIALLDKTDDPVKAATAGAIIFDKLALSTGQATSRTESRTWTDGLDPDARRKLTQWAFDRLDEIDGRAPVPGGSPAGAGVRESSADGLPREQGA